MPTEFGERRNPSWDALRAATLAGGAPMPENGELAPGLDSAYLRLDTTNDPLTGPLDIQVNDIHALRVLTEGDVFTNDLILDNFNRADEGPPPSSDWTSAEMFVKNNRMEPPTDVDGNNNGSATWNTPPASADEFDFITIYVDQALAEASSVGNPSIFLIRCRFNTGTLDGYQLLLNIFPPMFGNPGTGLAAIYRGGTFLTGNVAFEYHSGDAFGISAIGSHLVAWYKPAGGTWGSILIATDTGVTDVGQFNITINGNSGTAVTSIWSFDDFGGGDVSELPSGTLAETIFNVDSNARQTSAQQFVATTGNTPPLIVASIAKVDNLNSDLLDGSHATAFAPAAEGVTNGNSHDHIGGDGAPITEGAFNFSDVTTANSDTTKHGLLAKLSGRSSQYLGGDNDWHDIPTTLSFFMDDTNSDLSGFKTLTEIRPTGSIANVATSIPADNTLVKAFAAAADQFNFISGQVLHAHLHLAKTAGTKDATAHVEVIHRTSGGTETVLGTSADTGLLAGSNTPYDFDVAVTDTPFTATDRLVLRIFASPSGVGSTPTVTVYYQGDTNSRQEVGASSAGSAGTGDVSGPGSAVDGDFVLFDGTTGKLIKDAGYKLSGENHKHLASDGVNRNTPIPTYLFMSVTASGVSDYLSLVVTPNPTLDSLTGTITGADQYLGGFCTTEQLFWGPLSEQIVKVGLEYITNHPVEFYLTLYHRTSGGTETLLGTSEVFTAPLESLGALHEFYIPVAAMYHKTFSSTDYLVLKAFGNKISDDTNFGLLYSRDLLSSSDTLYPHVEISVSLTRGFVSGGNAHDHNGGDGAQISYGSLSGTPTIPTKASGAEIDTGTDDAKFATAKAIRDSGLLSGAVSGEIAGLTDKATPVDADVTLIEDSAATNAKKKLTWANIKATLAIPVKASGAEIDTGTDDAKFATAKAIRDSGLLSGAVSGEIAGLTDKATPVDADVTLIEDSAATNDKKKLTWTNIKATLKTYFDGLYAALSHTHSYIAGSTGSTDNAILRADGTGGATLQNAKGLIDDSGNLSVEGVLRANSTGTGPAFKTKIISSLANNGTAQVTVGADDYAYLFVFTDDATIGTFVTQGGVHSTIEVSDPSGIYSATAGTASSINIYWSAANSRYEVENKRGAARNIWVVEISPS